MSRVAVVTGGTRGIGAAISVALKNAGYKVAANYAGNDEKAKAFHEATGVPVFKWDVSDYAACGEGIAKGKFAGVRTIDLAPTIAYLMRIPEPQQSQGRVLLEIIKGGNSVTPLSIIGLNDFHGQLEPTTLPIDGRNVSVGGAAYLGTLFEEEAAQLPGRVLLLAGGDNVGASPPNSALLEDKPAIDVENAWGLDATSYGNHEFDYGVERLLMHQERANFPFLATALLTARLVRTVGARLVIAAGIVLGGAGTLALAFVEPGSTAAAVWPLPLIGLGFGLALPALSTRAMAAVEAARSGLASGVVNTSRQIGGTIGLSVLGAVGFHVASRSWATELESLPAAAQGRAAEAHPDLVRDARRRRSGGGRHAGRNRVAPERDQVHDGRAVGDHHQGLLDILAGAHVEQPLGGDDDGGGAGRAGEKAGGSAGGQGQFAHGVKLPLDGATLEAFGALGNGGVARTPPLAPPLAP